MTGRTPVVRPPAELVESFHEFGTSTISSALREECGILKSFMVGPVAHTPGLKTVGTATTVAFLPRREDIPQPSSVRSGGMHEILNIAEEAYRLGLLCIPHAWRHMIGVAAEVHLAVVAPNMPYTEYPMAFPDSPLISRLLTPRLEVSSDGTIEVPQRPGLGFELDEDTVARYREDSY
ncbi:MAG: enolase C-terminal domain-like protein [SAR202 cluster bacterium]|nr:enolase C-terminal domain-like protein [SAR202 cluster bacterium]